MLDSIPFYLFVAAVAYALQGQAWAMHLAMVATFWTTTGRLVRAEVLKLKSREFVLAARVIGLPGPLILARHVLPNCTHILLVQATLAFVALALTMWLTRNEDWGGGDRPRFRWPRRASSGEAQQAT